MRIFRIATALAVLASLSAFPASAKTPLEGPKAVVATPAIDTGSRAAVRAAYNTYYNLAMPPLGFTGDVGTCMPGSISLAFQEWTLSRINFLRAMAGVSGNTTLASSQNAQQQGAALITAANGNIDHFPPSTSTCYSAQGAQGAGSSNLSLGVPDSIPLYMSDAGNPPVGHRRWILHSGTGSFGLGQVEGGQFGMASALSVFNGGGSGSAPNGIPWPPRGYVPLDLFPSLLNSASQLWSFGHPDGEFSGANVTLLLNGSPVTVNIVSRIDIGYGDNTIVWQLPSTHTVAKDSVYDVTISGVGGAASTTYTYQIRPFDPIASIGTDLNSDGKSDLLYRNSSTGQVYRMLMNGFTISNAAVAYTEPNTAWKIVADADFNGDGVTDLLWRNASTGQVYVMPFNASGMPAGGGIVTTEPNAAWKIVHTPDLDGDGKADILWWNSSTGQVYAMIMNGGAITAQGFVYTEPNAAWKIVAVGDFAGSGKRNQLLWRNSSTGQVFLMTVTFAGGVFGQSGVMIYQEANTAWKIIGAADYNGDGKSDLLWRNDLTGQVYMMLMSGASIAGQGMVYTEPNLAWKIVAQGDYNGDGNADLLWRNDASGQVFMMRMNGLSIASQAMVYQEANTAWKVLGPWEYAQ